MLSSEESRPDGAATSAVDVVPGEGPVRPAADVGPELATWGQRVVAALLDNAILAGVTWLALGTGFTQPTLTPGLGLAPGLGGTGGNSWTFGPLVLVPVGAVAILLVLQALTGWTPGKLVIGIRVVRDGSDGQAKPGRPAGLLTTLVRWVLHLLDAFLFIGYLRPLWHERRQTFADGFVRTVVVQALPDLPRRSRTAVYCAALIVCVLGFGYGCVPMGSVSGTSVSGEALCELDSPGPLLTTGKIAPAGSSSIERDRRMWTVRETRTVRPGARITWTSDPSVRDVEYRVELDARPGSETGTPVVSRSWDIGTGDLGSWSDNEGFTHDRTLSADGDAHDVEVTITDADDAGSALGADVWLDVRLIADDEVLASCGGRTTFDEPDRGTP